MQLPASTPFTQDIGNASCFVSSELWRDGESLAAHFETDHALRYDVRDERNLLDR